MTQPLPTSKRPKAKLKLINRATTRSNRSTNGSNSKKRTTSKRTKPKGKALERKPLEAGEETQAALRRLEKRVEDNHEDKEPGWIEAALRKTPLITEIIKYNLGGRAGALRAMRFSSNPNIQEFLEVYDDIPEREIRRLSWEAIVIAAGLDATAFLGATLLAVQAVSANQSRMIMVSNHPDIVQKRVEYAKLAGGHRDRDAIDVALGALPQPKGGNTFIINPLQQSGDEDEEDGEEGEKGGAAVPVEDDGREEDLDHLFPDLKQTQLKVQPVLQLTSG